jgi:hypothetical protein
MNAPRPLLCRSGVALGLVLCTWRVPATGDPTISGYYNFADGAYDAAFDKAKHVKPFVRIGTTGGSDDPDFKLQACSVPAEAFEGFNPSIHVYEVGPDGSRSDLYQTADTTFSREMIGLSK